MATAIKTAKQYAESMSLAELQTMAEKLNIELIGKPKKVQIAELILDKRAAMQAAYKIEPSEPVSLLSMIEPQATEQLPLVAVEQATDDATEVVIEEATDDATEVVIEEATEQASVEPSTEQVTDDATEQVTEVETTEQAPAVEPEKTPVIIHPATDEAPPEVAKVFTIYTTADPSLDDEILKKDEKITRTLLEVKTPTGMRLFQIDLLDCSRGDVISQLGDYLFNGHNALTRSQWLKLTSDTEVPEDKKIKFPAMPKVVTEEKILALVELEDPQVDPFAAEENQKRIAEILAQIATLQDELRTLKKSSKSKSIGGSGLVIRQNVFKTGSTFDETVAMCNLIESEGYGAAMEQYGKTQEYVKRAYRAYSEIYLKSEVIKNLFDAKKISWAAIYKIAGSNPEKIGMAAIESKALAVAKP